MKHPVHPIGENDRELFDNHFMVSSAAECTGLIPSAPVDEASADAYSDLYDIPLAQSAEEARHDLQSWKKTPNAVNCRGIDGEGNAT